MVIPHGTWAYPERQRAVQPWSCLSSRCFSIYFAMPASPQSVGFALLPRRRRTSSQKVWNSRVDGNQAEPKRKDTRTGSISDRPRRGSPVWPSVFLDSDRRFCLVCCRHLYRTLFWTRHAKRWNSLVILPLDQMTDPTLVAPIYTPDTLNREKKTVRT